MDVIAPLVAHLQPPVAVHPRHGPLHYPPVSTQLLAGLDASPGYARRYAPLSQSFPTSGEVGGLIGVQLFGALAQSATISNPCCVLSGIPLEAHPSLAVRQRVR